MVVRRVIPRKKLFRLFAIKCWRQICKLFQIVKLAILCEKLLYSLQLSLLKPHPMVAKVQLYNHNIQR